MTDDPYPSPAPVVNAIAGFFIALLMFVPVLTVASERVKSQNKTPTTLKLQHPKFHIKDVTF